MARPRILTSELVDKMKGYLSSYDTAIPMVAGLSIHSEVSRSSLYSWQDELESKLLDNHALEDHESEFLDILDILGAEQELKLADGGLKGDYNPTISKLLLFKHGHSEKQDIQQDSTLVVEVTKDFD